MNQNELVEVSKNLTMEVVSSRDFQKELINLERKAKETAELFDQVKKAIKALMEAEQIEKIDGECVNIKYVAPCVKEGVDSKQILIEHPEFKQMYPKNTVVSSYVTLKIK